MPWNVSRRPVRRCLSLAILLLGGALSLTSCYGKDHPDPPPIRATLPGNSSVLGPTRTSPAGVDQLNALADRQRELFGVGYSVGVGDSFTINVLNHPEWTSTVTVLPDGRFYYGYLGRTIRGAGLTVEQVVNNLINGEPPLSPCPGCGWFHPPTEQRCPVCGADRHNVVDTTRVIFSSTALHAIQAAGGPIHPDAHPLRRVDPPAGDTDYIIVCERAVIGLDFRSLVEARTTWQFLTHTSVLAQPAPGTTLDPQTGPLLLRAGRRWMDLDLVDGKARLLPQEQTANLQPWLLRRVPEPNGLNYHFEDPQVMISDYVRHSVEMAVKVVGAVNSPGLIEIQQGARIWDVITDAGGPLVRTTASATSLSTTPTRDYIPATPTVDWGSAMLLREEKFMPRVLLPPGVTTGSMVRLQVDFAALVKGDPSQNIPVFPGDVLYIPEYAPESISVIAVGEIRSNEYFMQRPAWLMTLLARVGWLDEGRADLGSILLVRRPQGPRGDRELYVVNAMAMAKGQAMDIELENGDILYVYKDLITDVKDALAKIGPLFAAPASLGSSTYDAWDNLIDKLR